MVGTSPKQLESSVCKRLTEQEQLDPLKEDISQYLLLHHDYAAKPESEPKCTRSNKKLKTIKPKAHRKENLTDVIIPAVQTEEQQQNQEVLYGTYDAATNSITILVNGEPTPLTEPITEVITTIPETTASQFLTVPDSTTIVDPVSPASESGIRSDSSDCGYESYDSPRSAGETDVEMWDESISQLSELFPSLI